MKCIQFSSPFLPLLSRPVKNQANTNTFLMFPSQETIKVSNGSQRLPMRTKAITSSAILGVASTPVKGGDISVLIPTSAVLLIAYGIANFLVPALISKYYQFNNPADESRSKDDASSDG